MQSRNKNINFKFNNVRIKKIIYISFFDNILRKIFALITKQLRSLRINSIIYNKFDL